MGSRRAGIHTTGLLTGLAFFGLGALLLANRGEVMSVTSDAIGKAMDRAWGVLGRYFTWAELVRSTAASRLGLDNTPTAEAAANLRKLVERLLDPARSAMGKAWRITSGYRSDAVNRAVEGSPDSHHKTGQAVDFKVVGMHSSEAVAFLVRGGFTFDQAIWYDPQYGGHVHLSYVEGRNRQEVLHATTVNGRKGYVPWRPA